MVELLTDFNTALLSYLVMMGFAVSAGLYLNYYDKRTKQFSTRVSKL